jgi:uracil-DNA glycosylase
MEDKVMDSSFKQMTREKFLNVLNCDACLAKHVLRDDMFNLPQPGYVGTNYQKTRILFVGQNPGVSKFPEEDKTYARYLNNLKKNRNDKAYDELNRFLLEFIPQWMSIKRYSPLEACGLEQDDIAYINLVRCRTAGNAPPAKLVVDFCLRHFAELLDVLQPAAVVCLGKFAYNGTYEELASRNIPVCFINRARDRSLSQIEQDIKNAGIFVKNILGSKVAQIEPAVSKITPCKKRNATGVAGTYEGYCELFQDLGFYEFQLTKTLKHGAFVPSIYFNRNRDQIIYFTAYESQEDYFSAKLWNSVEGRIKIKDKDLRSGLINLIPKPGKIREAFESLLEK